MIKLFVADIDHTLYCAETDAIPQRNIEAINKLIEKGITICFASSRVYDGMKEVIEMFNLKENNGYVVAVNGSFVIRSSDDEILIDKHFTTKQIEQLHQLAEKLNVSFRIAQSDFNISTAYCEVLQYDIDNVNMDYIVARDVFKYIKDPVYKVGFSNDGGCIDELLETVKKESGDSFTFNTPLANTIDVSLKDINKLTGLLAVIKDMGITLDEVAAIGDNDNDAVMLEAAGISGCVANGNSTAKKAAKYIVASCTEAGVADFIEQYVLKRGKSD
ncbi:MAG: HAD family hydrolase [Bacillota bacterium]|jgi:Cof subfamily protein (haloacid dehalogenase superfamily)|nr:HAD family hydrolase [Bacillota bacterium]NLL25966.1 HAD family hydrolase [Erysipelotrichia bacterium]